MSEALELLFFDTFSHESNDEIKLDLVQFPKPVYIGEIRIIPLGARVQADFPGGVRLGATNPSQFKIEFFVNDLSKPGASTFENLGAVDYNQNGNIHFETELRHIPTDGLVLRGWYTTITLAVYGVLTKTLPPEPTPQDLSSVEWLQQQQQQQMDGGEGSGGFVVDATSGHYGSYPVQEVRPHQPPYPWHQETYEGPKEQYEAEDWGRNEEKWDPRKERHADPNFKVARYDRRLEERSPEYRERPSPEYERPASDFSYKRRTWTNPEWSGASKRPHTPPPPPSSGLVVVLNECSPTPGQFESMSPGDVESISEGDIPEPETLDESSKTPPGSPKQHQFEPILSEDEIDDQDMDYDFTEYSDEPLVSFNPYNNEIPCIKSLGDPVMSLCERLSQPFRAESTPDGQALLDLVMRSPPPEKLKGDWVEIAGQVINQFSSSFPQVATNEREGLTRILMSWVSFGIRLPDYDEPGPGLKLRHIKTGIRLVEELAEASESVAMAMITAANAQRLLLNLFEEPYMALVPKLMILKALDATLCYEPCIRHFVQMKGYEWLIDAVQTQKLARLKFSLTRLINKLNLYDLLVSIKETVATLETALKGKTDEELDFDPEFLALSLEETLDTYVEAKTMLSQPKRFLPAPVHIEIHDFPDPYRSVFSYFRFTGLLGSFSFLLSLPSQHLAAPINNLISELLESDAGLRFLATSTEINAIIRLLLGSSSKSGVNPTLGLHLAYRLQAISYLDSINSLNSDPDKPEILDYLQGLFSLTLSNIGNIGKSSVVHVLSQNSNLDVLLRLLKSKSGKKRSPSRGFICDLILLTVKLTQSIPFLKKYSLLTELTKTDFQELNEIGPWLSSIQAFDGEISSVFDVVKQHADNCAFLPPELISAVRLLKHLAVPRVETSPKEFRELKHKSFILQLYSLDGLSTLVGILQKICKFYEHPFCYSSKFMARQGLLLLGLISPSVQLIRQMLAHVIKVRNTEFKDLSAVPVLLKTYNLMQAVPLNAQAYTEAVRVRREIIETLLAYTQPVSSVESSENEALNKSLWTAMLSEVIQFTASAPLNFISGLMIISELLPLPLPFQARGSLTEEESAQFINCRRLWSAHLHSLHHHLEGLISMMCVTSCQPVVQILRRVCVQLSDLAAPTALMVVRTLYDSIVPDDPSFSHVLNFVACLVTHSSVKSAFLALSRDKPALLPTLISSLKASDEAQTQNQDIVSILLSLCDSEISLVSSQRENFLCNAVPHKELLLTVTSALLEVFTQAHSFSTTLMAMRTCIVLVEHDYGFYHVKSALERKPHTIESLLNRIVSGWSKDNHDLLATLSATLDFLRALASLEGVEYPLRTCSYSMTELLTLVKYTPTHPLHTIEANLKVIFDEDESLEPLLENVNSFIRLLNEPASKAECKGALEMPEPVLPLPDPLLTQFSMRSVYLLGGEWNDDRLTAAYWLAPPNQDDSDTEQDLIAVDLTEITKNYLNGLNLSEAVSQLLNRKTESDSIPIEEKKLSAAEVETRKTFVTPIRGRNLRTSCSSSRTDVFRSRPPNTSRPPSLHVDDFVALETCGGPPPLGTSILPDKSRARGRGRSFGLDRGGRFFGSHHPYRDSESVWERNSVYGTQELLALDVSAPGLRFRTSAAWKSQSRSGQRPLTQVHPRFFPR